MSTFSLSKFMSTKAATKPAETCIYVDQKHQAFNQAAKAICSKLGYNRRSSFSRPGKTMHNIKLCGVWPSAADCRTIWENLAEQYAGYDVSLYFNAQPGSRQYNHYYNGLCVAISVDVVSEHKAYKCPHQAYSEAKAKRDAAKEIKLAERAAEKQRTAEQEHQANVEFACITEQELQLLNNLRDMQKDQETMTSAWFMRSGFSESTKQAMKHDLDRLNNVLNFVVNYNK